jgi:glycosyltransferase involved in cell wall biosynthesis
VMKDTIGSNVICTSMATGLAMVVSDVGSIRDYCDETNACFCSSPDDFIKNIMILANDRELLNSLKKMSLKKAQQFSIDNYCVSLSSLLK